MSGRFTSVRANYTDLLVILSRGPYSGVDAAEAGYTEEEWLDLSSVIRRFHELTHVICRRLYPDDVDPVRDELIADAVGMYAAFGRFDPEKELLFLGIRGGHYAGGRLGIYTDEPDRLAKPVCAAADRVKALTDSREWADPFDLIPALMEHKL